MTCAGGGRPLDDKGPTGGCSSSKQDACPGTKNCKFIATNNTVRFSSSPSTLCDTLLASFLLCHVFMFFFNASYSWWRNWENPKCLLRERKDYKIWKVVVNLKLWLARRMGHKYLHFYIASLNIYAGKIFYFSGIDVFRRGQVFWTARRFDTEYSFSCLYMRTHVCEQTWLSEVKERFPVWQKISQGCGVKGSG